MSPSSVRVYIDDQLSGKTKAEMYEDDNSIIYVSPAMHELLKTDREKILNKMVAVILPKNTKPKERGVFSGMVITRVLKCQGGQ